MKALIERLKKDRLTIGSCESLTAGLFASTIAEVSGASAVLKGGIVTYWTECKVNVVHVREEIVEKYGVVSAPCAKEMAEKARLLLDVDLCVSFSGNVYRTPWRGSRQVWFIVRLQTGTAVRFMNFI